MSPSRYSGERLKRGLIHFVLGKGVSAIAGMLAMMLVIRELSIEAFAAYSVLVALVEMLTTISGLGLVHALLRYVPELYNKHYQASLRQLILGSLGLRSGVLLLASLAAYALANQFAPLVGLGAAIAAYKAFLLVVVLRSTTHFLSQILESTLHQGTVQLGFTSATIARLVGMLYLLKVGDVQLIDVIWVEVASDALSFVIMLYGVVGLVRDRSAENKDDDGSWIKANLKPITKFAIAGYLQHLAITPYGGHTNRLVGGGLLNISAMAAYGFAQSLYEYIKRYMPAQLLVGLIRPVVVARYSESRDFSVAAGLCSKVLQINILIIFGMYAVLVAGGGEALLAISAGKYGAEAMLILSVLFLVLLLETQRQQLELLVQTVERYHFLIFSNILLALSILLAVICLPLLGAVAFPAANAVGLLVANYWVQRNMQLADFRFKHDWFATIRGLVLCTLSAFVGLSAKHLGLPWYLAASITGIVYAALAYVICGSMVRTFTRELTGNSRGQLPMLDEHVEGKPVKIAFGVLSSKHSAGAIDEIAHLVFPHPVYVHHDFTKQADFVPTAINVQVLQQPVTTAWGDWSLVEASCCLMRKAMEDPEVTYFQLLSEACLPIRPIAEFEAFLVNNQPDAMIDMIPLMQERALFSHGWRYFQHNTFTIRLLRRASIWVWGKHVKYQAEASVNLRLSNVEPGLRANLRKLIGKSILHIFAQHTHNKLAESGFQQLAIGGQWFGASRRVVNWLLCSRHHDDMFTRHYQHSHIPDESYFHTLLLNAKVSGLSLRLLPSNHVSFWNGCHSGPDVLTQQDHHRVYASGKFFARKFSLDKTDQLRKFFSD